MASYRQSRSFKKSGGYSYGKQLYSNARSSGQLYALPIIGDTIKKYDNYRDYAQMQADYTKNTGRKILYPSVRAYSSQSYSSLGNVGADILGFAGRTVKRLI